MKNDGVVYYSLCDCIFTFVDFQGSVCHSRQNSFSFEDVYIPKPQRECEGCLLTKTQKKKVKIELKSFSGSKHVSYLMYIEKSRATKILILLYMCTTMKCISLDAVVGSRASVIVEQRSTQVSYFAIRSHRWPLSLSLWVSKNAHGFKSDLSALSYPPSTLSVSKQNVCLFGLRTI